jgi:hypothetical protein
VNSGFISRSQLLLEYLLALEVAEADQEALERPQEVSSVESHGVSGLRKESIHVAAHRHWG